MIETKEILDQAVAALRRETNLTAEEIQLDYRLEDGRTADAFMRIDVLGKTAEYWVEIKPTMTNVRIAQTAQKFRDHIDRWLLVTRYVYPELGRNLRELGIQYIDTVGNAHIKNPPALIVIQAHRRKQDTFAARQEGMFGAAGVKVVFGLLCKPQLLLATYREMTTAVGVALGTVTGVMKELNAQGYAIENAGKNRRLLRKKELLENWIEAYAQKLRAKLFIGHYAANRPNFWQDADITRFGAQWGGETAANRMTHYLKPEITTIYATKPVTDLIVNLKLRKGKQGDVELRERFWNFQNEAAPQDLVPPLLVYTDLLATGDARNIETAKMIYDEYLERLVGQD